MARPVRTPMNEVSGADDEFQLHVERGAEQLSRGNAEAARESLSHAAELRPGDLKALGLLGQALYRLGKFDEAAALFGKLVEQNPLEAGAQVNLGLANLRAKRYVEAISHLEKALDLNPDHRKAMGYLGLAWLEHGNVARAREWFSRGGSDHMVARCDELLAAARRSASTPADPQWAVAAAADTARAAEEPREPKRELPPDDEAEISSAMRMLGDPPEREPANAWDEASPSKGAAGWKLTPITVIGPLARCTEPGPAPLPPPERDSDPAWAKPASVAPAVVPVAPEAAAEPDLRPEPAEVAQAIVALDVAAPAEVEAESPAAPAADEAQPAFDVDEAEPITIAPVLAAPDAPVAPAIPKPITLEQIAANGLPAVDEDAQTFATDRGILRVSVHGEVLTRVSQLVAMRGDVEMTPETRRYRGRGTDKLFGDGRQAMHRLSGEGALLLRQSDGRHTIVDLAGSAGFFREDCVFAMEAAIEFDNARLTARAGPDVDLVHLRGEGSFVLVTRGEVVAVEVSEAPLRVAASALIGWTGALTPRLTTLAERGSSDTRAVELTGEGRVLLDSGSTDG